MKEILKKLMNKISTDMEMENFHKTKLQFMMDNGKMIYHMEKVVYYAFRIDISMMDMYIKVSSMDQEKYR